MKHKTLRTLLCVILTVCFCLSAIVPASAAGLFGGDSGAATGWDQLIRGLKDRFIEKNPGTDETPAEPMTGTGEEFIRIFHLDCGRKYFTVQQIKDIINQLAANHYTHIELAIGNDALRFLLDDMDVKVNDTTTYTSDAVKAGIQKGNLTYTTGSSGELTQSEMDEIISYANGMNISVIPLLNSPGHMDAILKCMIEVGITSPAYSDSKRTVDVTKGEAVAFTQALIKKYVDYFAAKGCEYFNIGADEYANDVTNGFAGLISSGNYVKFVDYVNDLADYINGKTVNGKRMIPIAFNDGIYYNGNTEKAFRTSLAISFWTAGWSGYSPASASFLAEKGHKIINTNDAWYYVLGRQAGNSSGYTIATAESGTKNTKVTTVPGKTFSKPIGAMLCLWCDNPSADYNETEYANLKTLIKNLSKANPTYFTAVTPPAPTISGAPTEALAIGRSVTLSVSGGADATWTVDNENVLELKAVAENVAVAAEGPVQASSVTATAIARGSATVTAATADGKTASATIQVYEEGDPNTVYVTVAAGETTDPIRHADGDMSGDTISYEPAGNVEATLIPVKETSGDPVETPLNSLTFDDECYIKTYSDKYFTSNGGTTTDATKAQKWKWSNYKLSYDSNGSTNYLSYDWSYGTTTYKSSATNAYFDNGKLYRNRYEIGQSYIYRNEIGTPVSITFPTPTIAYTNVIFTGIVAGTTTNVRIGDTLYVVTVTDKAPSTALTATSIDLEYWITNYPVHVSASENSAKKATIRSIDAGVQSENGIAIASVAIAKGNSNFDGWKEVYYWQAMRLDADNHQTNASGDDETADGTTLTHVRYHSGAWQYKTVDGTWHYFMTGDQLVAYYLQKTEVTKEIETYSKDWGYGTNNEDGHTPNTSSGNGQAALTIAIVYPDGSVSPAEANMYSQSTTIFNYWAGRDIGIVAPVNNSDYNIAKITVTDGTRDKNKSDNVWYNTDTITWKTKANEAGVEWYDETTVWDKVTNAGTTPMVNGKPGTTTTDGIIWSAKNTAKLVLIYLEPVEKPDNLTVIYYDDNADAEITRVPVVVENGVTFKTHLKDGNGNVIGGTMNWPAETVGEGYLPDDAYVTNTSGVNQTFSKQISTLQNISSVYKSGIYKYVSANIDANDDKILILHFNLKSANGAFSFVVDFGLPITIHPGDIGIADTTTIQKASLTKATPVLSNEGKYGTATIAGDYSKLTYTLHRPLDKIATIPLFVTFKDNTVQEFQINIIPATNVYYEENFINVAENSTVWTDTDTARNPDQALEKSDAQKYVYGYDPEYATATDTYSMGNAKKATLTLSADAFSTKTSEALTFTFEGDGYDIISECGTNVGLLVAYTYRVENGKETLKYIDIMDNYFCGDDTYIKGDGILAAQVPVIRKLNLSDGYGKYKVKIIGYLRQTAGVLNVSDSMAAQSYAAMASVDSPVVYDYESSTNAIVDEILADLGVANLADVDVRVSFVDKNSILNGGTGVFAKETVQDMKNDLRSAYTVQANEGYKAGSAVVYVDAFRVYNPLGHDTTNLPTAYSDAKENDMRYDSVYEYVSASGADIGDEYIENSAVYVEYDGNKGIATISEYKKQGPENEVYLTANGPTEQHFIGFVINGWEELANRKLIVSAKIVSGEPSLVTRDAASNESVVAVSDLPDPGQKQLSKTEQYFDLTNHVIYIDGKWVLIIGNKSDVSSVLSISGIRIKNNCTAGTTLEDVSIITGIISSESAADFTPVKFSETHKSKVRVNKSAYISINASEDVTSFKLYAVDGNTKTEVTDDFTYDWTNQKAFNAGSTDIKSYSAYVKVGATAGEKKYELVAVNAGEIESNPIKITITVVQ